MLTWLRTYAPPLAALLLVLVTMQLLDLPLCADEAEEAALGHTTHAAANYDVSGSLRHATPCDDSGDQESSAIPDCLCHVVFTRMEALPTVAAAPSDATPVPLPLPSDPSSVEPDPIDHIPLA